MGRSELFANNWKTVTAPLPSNTNDRVFEWLGVDGKGVPYHLHPLRLVWSDAGVEHDLGVYQRVAQRLALDVAYWSELIRDVNWRCTLVGCVCLLVSRRKDFYEDLRFRFEMDSMVTPQIAVTMGLLHPVEARTYFESILRDLQSRNKARRRVSAECALVCLGERDSSEVTLDGWGFLDQDDAILANQMVQLHWGFWKGRV